MQLLVVLLSIILVLNALFLILLILIQLPKKEAGAGIAFGSGATDALFGAGSGNALTKMTKYAATFFLALVLGLSFLSKQSANDPSNRLERELEKAAKAAAAVPQPMGTPAVTSPNTNVQVKVTPLPATNVGGAATNLAAPATNSPVPVPATPPAAKAP